MTPADLLDTDPPPLRPVDVPAIHRAALERQRRVGDRWRRAALGTSALAAGLLLAAVWPKPPTAEPDPRVQQLWEAQARQADALRAADARQAELRDLLLTLAQDVGERDARQAANLRRLAAELREFEGASARQFRETDRTNAALYNVVFSGNPRGDKR